MAEHSLFDAVTIKLDQALDRLEAAIDRRLNAEQGLHSLEEQLVRLEEDRSKLGADLDDAVARASRLEDANREVSRRLVAAMESIRAVLDAHSG